MNEKQIHQIPKTLPDLEYEDLEEEQAVAAQAVESEEEAVALVPEILADLDYDPFEEERQFPFTSLDEALQAVAECVSGERGSQWKLGAVVASAVDVFGRYGTYQKLAGVCAYTTRRLKTFEDLHRAFPPEVRYPDQPLLLYEVALGAPDPIKAVTEAVEAGLSPRQLADGLVQEKGGRVSQVQLYRGEAMLQAEGPTWWVHVDAGRDWPEGDGFHPCFVIVRQVIEEGDG